jgi:hypothetical protein
VEVLPVRPVTYSEEVAEAICEAVATTPRGVEFICRTNASFPNERTVRRWQQAHPEFRLALAVAKEWQADLLAYEGLEIADDASGDKRQITRQGGETETVLDFEFVARSKLRCEQRRWMAGKLSPSKYGDRLDLNAHVGVMSQEDALDQLR